ncbi:MAG: radical SAM protein [Candidatus Lokiarchaeota archaeon]|nr:radical SAM protein [Candidatus Lokiarchaeota archaeon]
MQVCLTSDETSFINPRAGFFITGFIPSIPKEQVPIVLRYPMEKLLFNEIETYDGFEVIRAPLSLRRIEAVLLRDRIETKVISPQKIDKLIEEVEIFGISTMDPLGLGPVSATLRGILNNNNKEFLENRPYTAVKFEELISTIRKFDKPIILGGSGACQFELIPEKQEEFGIDCVVIGDGEQIASEIFKKMLQGKKLPKIIKTEKIKDVNNQVLPIIKPTYYGIIEISRGCDRHCKFCDPTMRYFHWFEKDQILLESKRNSIANEGVIRLLSEDCLRYGNKMHDWVPRGGLVKLIQAVKKIKTVKKVGLSHGCIASALANPEQIERISEELNLSKENFTSLQVGIETGSINKIIKYMPLKTAPFEPDDWHDVVLDGWKLLCKHHIYPAGTIILGMDDTKDDLKDTLRVVKKISKYPGMFFPLFFMSLGQLKDKESSYRNSWWKMPKLMKEIYITSLNQLMRQTEHIDGLVFGNDLAHRIMNQIIIVLVRGVYKTMEENVKNDTIPSILSLTKSEVSEAFRYVKEKIRVHI